MSFLFYAIIILIYLGIVIRIAALFFELGASNASRVVGILIFLAGLFIPVHILLCTNVWWYGEKVLPPEISISFKDNLLSKQTTEPLLGEGIVQDEDGNYAITLIDHRIHVDDYDKTPDLEIKVVPENATIKKAKATLTITQFNERISDNTEPWYRSYDNDSQATVTTLDDKFNFTINGSGIPYSENNRTNLTKYRIVAKNKRGEASTLITITRYPLYYACELYNNNHPDKSAVEDIPLCKARAEYSERHESSSNTNNSNNSGSSNYEDHSTNSSSSHHPSGSTCLHYEAGRCWDDLEEAAYSQGQYDKIYGHYGDSYYESDNCDNVCQSILENAYDEGYDNY